MRFGTGRLIAVFLLSTAVAALGAEGSVSVTIPTGIYDIQNTTEGQEIVLENFGRFLVPGKPDIPSKIFSIAIPPGAKVIEVTFDARESKILPGKFLIPPVKHARVISEENPAVRMRELAAYETNYAAVYGSDDAYPASVGEFVRPAGYRKYNLADVRIFPFTYHPVSGRLLYHSSVEITVHYDLQQISEGNVLDDNLAGPESLAEEIIINFAEASEWYPASHHKIPIAQGLYEFVIITLESLTSAVQPLVDWEVGKGRTVNVVTTTWIDENYTGYDLAEKIRNFLRDKYPSGEWGIENVCLVGDDVDVPMRRCWQDVGYGKPKTDFYYAELSLPDDQSWDADGDRRWGEDSDPVDFMPEVFVGRIPWSITSTVESICNRSVAYESNSDPAYKKNILLLGAFFWDDTDTAVLMEYKTDSSLHPWMTDWTRTRMYEKDFSSYPCDYPLTKGNVMSVWSSGAYAFVNWAGHGSPTACHKYYDGIQAFINWSDCPHLNVDYPAIVFADACSNSDTDYLNLGKAMLQNGAIGFLGSTKVAYGREAWNDPMDGSSQSLDYYFTTRCTSGRYTQGQAHQWALRQMYVNGLWDYQKYETFEWGALWGNPDLSMGTQSVLAMIFPDGLPEGLLPPGPETTIRIEIRDGLEAYVPGTGKLHYRFNPKDPYTEVPVTRLTGNMYSAVIPPAEPGEAPEFYFSAKGSGGTRAFSPFSAPDIVYSFDICLVEELFYDNFEEDAGWIIEDINLDAGSWERCVPDLTSGEQVAPAEDNPDGTGTHCFVTENAPVGGYYSDYDIDGGPTWLISPMLDLSDNAARISFYAWFYGRDGDDPFSVEISNDNGITWKDVYSTYNSLVGWTPVSFDVTQFVTLSSRIRVRFGAQDNPNNSVTEAGVDDFKVELTDYDPSIWAQKYSFSKSDGCAIDIYMNAGHEHAGRNYVLVGSLSGSRPGTQLPGGEVIPLNRDVLTEFILNNLNGFVFRNFSGALDENGRAVATLNIPGQIGPTAADGTITFAFTLTGGFDFVSNPVFVEIGP